MDAVPRIAGTSQHWLHTVAIGSMLAVAAVACLLFDQIVAAALMPLIGLLLAAIARRDRRAMALAQAIDAGPHAEKIEVQRGNWGMLTRAINNLLQERRIFYRLRSVAPEPLPEQAMRMLLTDGLPSDSRQRPVAILLVSPADSRLMREGRQQRAILATWQALATVAQELAQQYGALLQPCGGAIMLAFGAFGERPLGRSLRAAQSAAETLQRRWPATSDAGGALVLCLTSGYALTAVLPGLGYCVLGAPIEQAAQLQQSALHAGYDGLLCGEESYHALRYDAGAAWQPTDLRLAAPHRPSQVVYGWDERISH